MTDYMRYIRFFISGAIGTALFKVVHDIILSLCTLERGCPTLSWLLSYMLSIVWQHALHQLLVFGTADNYWTSLLWTYVSYTASFLVSTALNWVLVENIGLSVGLAWVLTLASTGLAVAGTSPYTVGPINYLSLNATAFKSTAKQTSKEN